MAINTKKVIVGGLVGGALTRRELLLTLPGLVVARRLLAQVGPEPLRARGLHSVTLALADVEWRRRIPRRRLLIV